MSRPDAWVFQVARRAAIDRFRASRRHENRLPDLTLLMEEDETARASDPAEIPGERLRLMFTCCPPALEEKTHVALTLRGIGGLSTRDIARLFDSETAMKQRLSRTKARIAPSHWPRAMLTGPG
jgi:RNA polymerase sigma-70 factor (ECF subfamily)